MNYPESSRSVVILEAIEFDSSLLDIGLAMEDRDRDF